MELSGIYSASIRSPRGAPLETVDAHLLATRKAILNGFGMSRESARDDNLCSYFHLSFTRLTQKNVKQRFVTAKSCTLYQGSNKRNMRSFDFCSKILKQPLMNTRRPRVTIRLTNERSFHRRLTTAADLYPFKSPQVESNQRSHTPTAAGTSRRKDYGR